MSNNHNNDTANEVSDAKTFKMYIDNLPYTLRIELATKLKSKLEWSRATFSNKLNGKSKISEAEKIAINSISQYNVFK